VAVKWK